MTKYIVEVVKTDWDSPEGGEVVKKIDCGQSQKKAKRVEDGVNINLNHEDYHTRITLQD